MILPRVEVYEPSLVEAEAEPWWAQRKRKRYARTALRRFALNVLCNQPIYALRLLVYSFRKGNSEFP